MAETQVPDEIYEHARRCFDEEELVKLTLLIGAINVWNRISVGFRTLPPVESASQPEVMS